MILFLVIGAALLVGISLSTDEFAKKVDTVENWTKWDNDFIAAGKTYQVPWTWLKAIALNESSLGAYPSVAHGIQEPTDIEGSKSQDG